MAAGDATYAPPPDADAEARAAVSWISNFTSMSPDDVIALAEAHNWDLQSFIGGYYDSADGPDPATQPPPPAADDGAESEEEDYVGGGDDEDYGGGGEDEDAALAAAPAAVDERRRSPAKRQKSNRQARGGSGGACGRGTVRMLSDLPVCKRAAGSEGDVELDEDEWAPPPELYTGGEKSGMVRDRSKGRNVADEVFKQAKRKGAKPGPARRQSSSSRNFPGTSKLLRGDTVQSDAPQPPEEIVYNIYFWSNGFTVDDGPLRSFDDPEHASFLKSIKNSECPTELAPADGRSKVNVNLVRKEEKCPEPVKRRAPFQGGGRTVASHLASKPNMAATFPRHPEEQELVVLLRRWIQGDTQTWIYEANVYAEDPVSLTSKYLPATAAHGSPAWYFVCIPRKKDGNDDRISRVAGSGTWKEERKYPVEGVSHGIHVQVGRKQTFSYVIKSKTEGVLRVGWILKCIMLNEGEDAQQRCLCKVYRSPQKDGKSNRLVAQLAILAPTPVIDDDTAGATLVGAAPAATTAAAATTTPAAAASPPAPTTAAATEAATATPPPAATAATTAATATPTPTPTPTPPATTAAAPAITAATTATPPPAVAAATAPATTAAASSPPKKWLKVQISDSPKSSDRPKRVYQMIDISAQDGVGDVSKKRMKMLNFEGWLY